MRRKSGSIVGAGELLGRSLGLVWCSCCGNSASFQPNAFFKLSTEVETVLLKLLKVSRDLRLRFEAFSLRFRRSSWLWTAPGFSPVKSSKSF
jgi:hypothetical protein